MFVALACSTDTEANRSTLEQTPNTAGAGDAEAAGAYLVIDVPDGGSIRGTVQFTGDVPGPRTVHVTEDVETCGTTQQVQSITADARQGVADAVVSLIDIRQGAAIEAPELPPTLDQRRCRFAPHVLIARTNAAVRVLNNDPLTHNVHTASFDNRPVNRAQPPSLREIEMTFETPERVRVKCDIHAWMSAWVIVIDHPYHAITSETGSFVIDNVPPGTYTLEIWHETLGTSTQSVTITANRTTTANIELTDR